MTTRSEVFKPETPSEAKWVERTCGNCCQQWQRHRLGDGACPDQRTGAGWATTVFLEMDPQVAARMRLLAVMAAGGQK